MWKEPREDDEILEAELDALTDATIELPFVQMLISKSGARLVDAEDPLAQATAFAREKVRFAAHQVREWMYYYGTFEIEPSPELIALVAAPWILEWPMTGSGELPSEDE